MKKKSSIQPNFYSRFRQLKYPKEFRIVSPVSFPDLSSSIEKLQQILISTKTIQPENGILPKEQLKLLAEIGTGLWRLRQKMVKPDTGQPIEEMRKAYRHLESVWDALVQSGVEIQDHTGKPFDSGLMLKVLAFQPLPGVTREKIMETIKPTVYFKKKSIQIGEVIVATPEKKSEEQNFSMKDGT